jgi:hypothetical protein
MNEADVLEVLRYTNSFRAKKTDDAGVQMNLEKIERLKRDLAMKPKPVAPVARRPSEAFDQIEMPALQHYAQPVQQFAPPIHHVPMQQSVQPARAKSIKDIPAMQPVPKNGPVPTVLSSTTVISGPSTLPPNPLSAYLATSPPQQASYGQYGQPQSVPQMTSASPALLPNLAQPRAYVAPQPQLTQQRVYQVQTGPSMQQIPAAQQGYQMPQQHYPVLNTTQVRTEYYGTQQPQHMPAPYAPMMSQQSSMHPQYQHYAPGQYANQRAAPGQYENQQAALAGLQNLHLQAPAPKSNAAVGDKYSIFRYVDPSAPQVLPQPGSDPNIARQSQHQSYQQRP